MAIEQLNPLYTFHKLFVGTHNQFAHAAALAVAEAPGKAYNPLYIYGGYSESRTHLLHAIGHAILEKNRQARLLYISSRRFISEMKNARSRDAGNSIQTSKFPELEWGSGTSSLQTKEDYCKLNVLLVDNVQHLIHEEEAQAELLFIFDTLYNSQRQIVFSGDCPLQELNVFERLPLRSELSLIAEIELMDPRTFADCLKRMAEIRKVNLPYNVAFSIASKLRSLTDYSDFTEMRLFELITEKFDEVRAKAKSSLNTKALVNEIISKVRKEIALGAVKRVLLISATAQVLEMLQRDYSNVYQLSPENFEILICDRFSEMGLDVKRVGSTYSPDGGVDIIACPRRPAPFPFLIAAQVKHHMRPSKKTGPDAVKDLQAVMSSMPFHVGLLVTSTTFTPSARWVANHYPHIIRLRDMKDLQRWIWNNFTDDAEWREIPSTIELAPGVNIKLTS